MCVLWSADLSSSQGILDTEIAHSLLDLSRKVEAGHALSSSLQLTDHSHTGSDDQGHGDEDVDGSEGGGRPAYTSIFARICREIGQQYGSTPAFLKIRTQSFQKVRKSRRERCKCVASEASRRALMRSYHSLTFVCFKPFLGLKYMAGPDWSEKVVKPMNINFALKLY